MTCIICGSLIRRNADDVALHMDWHMKQTRATAYDRRMFRIVGTVYNDVYASGRRGSWRRFITQLNDALGVEFGA